MLERDMIGKRSLLFLFISCGIFWMVSCSPKICEEHNVVLTKQKGYSLNSNVMFSPSADLMVFLSNSESEYPHRTGEFWNGDKDELYNERSTLYYCETCEKNFKKDFDRYLTKSEQERERNYVEWLGNADSAMY